MQKPSACPKCQGSMVEGFVVDHTYGGHAVAAWAEGPPQKSFWVGVKVSEKETLEIRTYRCNRCGYLENYAG